jgi:hypothetical protein
MATTRERLHEILNALPESRLVDAEAVLEPLVDPVLLAFLNAPEDDEPTTDEDLQALDDARAEYDRGETISLDAAMKGLSESRTDQSGRRTSLGARVRPQRASP